MYSREWQRREMGWDITAERSASPFQDSKQRDCFSLSGSLPQTRRRRLEEDDGVYDAGQDSPENLTKQRIDLVTEQLAGDRSNQKSGGSSYRGMRPLGRSTRGGGREERDTDIHDGRSRDSEDRRRPRRRASRGQPTERKRDSKRQIKREGQDTEGKRGEMNRLENGLV